MAEDRATERAENTNQQIDFDQDDWRVRLHLAPKADYLYKALNPGILAPLVETNGIIFPYTPEIQVQYNANYENYDLTHSNYRGYFYTGSQVENIIVTATFTANDLREANYMLASMHFLRSATKMFYGQDLNRGMPPPLVFLTGLGEYQFNNHPCAITMMNYNLPTDVDFIPCGIATGVNDGAPLPRPKPKESGMPEVRVGSLGNIKAGGHKTPNSQTTDNKVDTAGPDVTYQRSTYVPTKIEINFTMIPIQTREQVSGEFSLEDYASGELLRKGFW